MIKYINLNKKLDYTSIFGVPQVGFTETTDGVTIPSNTFAWNDTLKAFRGNDAGNDRAGCLVIPIGEVQIGDVIDITVEVKNINGTKSKLSLDYTNNGNLFILQSVKSGEFETIGGKFIITKNDTANIKIGLFTADIGDFYVRNVDIKISTRTVNESNPLMGTPVNCTYANGWTGTLQVSKNNNGMVWLRGTLTPGTIAYNTQMAIIPNGYLPASALPLSVVRGQFIDNGIYVGTGGGIQLRKPLSDNITTETITISTVYYSG